MKQSNRVYDIIFSKNSKVKKHGYHFIYISDKKGTIVIHKKVYAKIKEVKLNKYRILALIDEYKDLIYGSEYENKKK